MFYSHEILTSREGGVATVWLVATLGSRSNLKKVNRKAILEVDVRKTCEIIITPEAPMALRLQSNLLYGVSRVYSQQCGYVLTDAQTAQANMRALIRAVRTSEIDPEAGKARPDQLVLDDDPAFVPDLAMPTLDLDLSALDLSTDVSSRRSSLLSPPSQRTSISSAHASEESMLGLIIPSSDIGGAGDLGGFELPVDDRSSAQRSARMRSILGEDEGGFDLEPGFNFDADGNIIEDRPGPIAAARPAAVSLGSDTALSAMVRQQIEEGMGARQINLGDEMDLRLDLDIPEDQPMLPQAEPFPPGAPQAQVGESAAPDHLRSSSEARPEESSSISAEAPVRRRPRAPRPLGMDDRRSLRNMDLASWNNDYVANMVEAARTKAQNKLSTLTKRNARFWVSGSGVGNVGSGFGQSRLANPLSIFAGASLMSMLTGTVPAPRGHKRSHDEEEEHDSDSEARRVRAREEASSQIGRGDNLALPEDDTAFPLNIEEDIEIGRHAPPALEDYSSQMPWNISASLHGSRAGSIARARVPSLGGPPSLGGASPPAQANPARSPAAISLPLLSAVAVSLAPRPS